MGPSTVLFKWLLNIGMKGFFPQDIYSSLMFCEMRSFNLEKLEKCIHKKLTTYVSLNYPLRTRAYAYVADNWTVIIKDILVISYKLGQWFVSEIKS